MELKKINPPQIGRKTLSDQVYEFLKGAIIFQEIPQTKLGVKLNETELASLLGVSQTPIREALNMLRKEGLVLGNSYQGSTVIDFSIEDIDNIFEMREILEITVIRHAYRKFTKEDYEKLEEILNEYENVYSDLDFREISEVNNRFHNYLVDKSGNKWLKKFLDSINDYLIMVRSPIMKTRKENKGLDNREAIIEHKEILNALKNGDLNQAEMAMKKHINRVKKEICVYLEKRDADMPLKE
ncbi:GntR family transcriptional regulator [Candidatus Formimonas warabiya]|uniref:HTH gntR-type domain-containing protein n=1 Tax=Formimonas warabiya TaxID=1761012 RepID=A0A3G1KM08_FORW1|nr:GntR family transcriptional regulator [Candidatus Formimonas warabiya]ATW23472.1 hypothetical protein DCMF_00475 [Candidatus Formimonas warabiya]